MTPSTQAHDLLDEVKRFGVAADTYPFDPSRRQLIQGAVSQVSRRRGIKVRTCRQFVEGENLLVVWRVA